MGLAEGTNRKHGRHAMVPINERNYYDIESIASTKGIRPFVFANTVMSIGLWYVRMLEGMDPEGKKRYIEAILRKYGNKEVSHGHTDNLQEEDKQAVCTALLPVLQMTRDLHDLTDLTYRRLEKGTEIVTATFSNGATKSVNVSHDSECAMIIDIIARIQ